MKLASALGRNEVGNSIVANSGYSQGPAQCTQES
jgi:hypothetical protein